MEAVGNMELLEIEKELKGEGRAAALEKYDRQLVALDERCRAAMGAGLPPDEFRMCGTLAEAVTVARKLLRLQVKD